MNGWLESVQQVIATLSNFFHLVIDSVSTLGDTVSESFTYINGCISMLPAGVVAAAALCLVVGLVFLVVGR